MVKEFQEGEIYSNSAYDKDVMVLGVHSETQDEVTIAMLWVDRETTETTSGGTLKVKKSDFGQWTEVKFE